MSDTTVVPADTEDAMAAEWAAALAKPEQASELQDGGDQVAPASFTNFAPTPATCPPVTST